MKPTDNTLKRPGETIVFLEYPQDVHYKYVKLLCTVQPGMAVGPHKHPKLTETFRVITGMPIEMVVGGKTQRLQPNDPLATTVLPNAIHEWVNDTNEPLTFEVTFYPRSGHSLQEINVIEAFMSYFALMNEPCRSSRLVHKLTTAMKFAVSEYTFRNFSVSGSIVGRVKVFLLAQVGQLLGLRPYYSEPSCRTGLFRDLGKSLNKRKQ